jgi:hypothetical protein
MVAWKECRFSVPKHQQEQHEEEEEDSMHPLLQDSIASSAPRPSVVGPSFASSACMQLTAR